MTMPGTGGGIGLEILSLAAVTAATSCLLARRAGWARCAQAAVMAAAMCAAAVPGRPAAATLVAALAVLASAPLSLVRARGAVRGAGPMDVHRSLSAITMSALILLTAAGDGTTAMPSGHHAYPAGTVVGVVGAVYLLVTAWVAGSEGIGALRSRLRASHLVAAIEVSAMGCAVASMVGM